MKKISWLDDFAKSQKEKATKMKKTASVKTKVVASVDNADMLIISKDKLPKAVEGNTVKYKNIKWKVVNASFEDDEEKGVGVVLEKLAEIDTKPLTAPETRANTNPGDVYDYNVRETSEISDFKEAEKNTAETIALEHATDMTTPDGRYSPKVAPVEETAVEEEKEEEVVEEEAPVVEETPVVEEAVEDAEPVADFNIDEEVEEEAPVEETPVEDAPVADDEEAPVADEEAPVVVEEEPTEVEETPADDFSFEGVDEEETEEEAPVEEEEEKEEEVKASVKTKNRILMAMLKK